MKLVLNELFTLVILTNQRFTLIFLMKCKHFFVLHYSDDENVNNKLNKQAEVLDNKGLKNVYACSLRMSCSFGHCKHFAKK